jgi:hypothetical protein
MWLHYTILPILSILAYQTSINSKNEVITTDLGSSSYTVLTFFCIQMYGNGTATKHLPEVNCRSKGILYLHGPKQYNFYALLFEYRHRQNHKSLPKQNIRAAVVIQRLANTYLYIFPN